MPVPEYLLQGAARGRARRPARTISRPPPVLGMNTLDEIGDLKPQEAEFLSNAWADGGHIQGRPGYSLWCNLGNASLPARSIFSHQLGSVSKLFTVSDGRIYDVTTGTKVTSLVGLNSIDLCTATIGNNTIACTQSSEDTIKRYDGSSWQTAAYTSGDIDVKELIGCGAHQTRMYFWRANDMNFYYSGIGAVQGALTKFPFENLGTIRGDMVAFGSWTIDAGAGVQDLAVFIFSEGDIMVYSGSDPGDATNFALVGQFQTARPIGAHRCVMNYGPDLVITTSDGPVSMRSILSTGPAARQNALSRKIMPTTRAIAKAVPDNDGWDSIFSTDGSMIIFSAPAPAYYSSDYIQFVYNPELKSWFLWQNIPALSWAEWNGGLYFCTSDGKVCKFADGATDDDGEGILVEANLRWDGLENQNLLKKALQIQPIFLSEGDMEVQITVLNDFNEDGEAHAYQSQTVTMKAPGQYWDDPEWDEKYWSGESRHFDWFTISGTGHRFQARFKINLSGGKTLKWVGTKWICKTLAGQK